MFMVKVQVAQCEAVERSASHQRDLTAVPMDTVTEVRNEQRPRRETKTGEKLVNEKPRLGNGLTHNHIPVVGASAAPRGEGPVGGGVKKTGFGSF